MQKNISQTSNGMNIYMIGIGGIGMSALAQLYVSEGHTVTGSDRVSSPTTELLKSKGIMVHIGQTQNNLPEPVDLVVFSDAVPESNEERTVARERGIKSLSYFEALGEVSAGKKTIAIAGTHGKTTTTAMLGSILVDLGVQPTVVVGSIIKEFGSNFRMGRTDAPFVVEACEHKDHILELNPSILVITNIEWDHTDYFKTFEQLKETFKKAVQKLPKDGALLVDLDTEIGQEMASYAPCEVIDFCAVSIPKLKLIGTFNAMHAASAKAAALAFDPTFSEEAIDKSLAAFAGTWRRFEFHGETDKGALVYDDYAHHPNAILETLKAVRKHFPGKRIAVAFEPHMFSRTRDFMQEFTEALLLADEVIIAPIYAAREEPIPGVTAETLAEKIGAKAQAATSLDHALQLLQSHDSKDTILITMGAGDIYKVAEKLV